MAPLQLVMLLGLCLVLLPSSMMIEAAPGPPPCCVKTTVRTLQFYGQIIYNANSSGPICQRPISGPLGTSPALVGYAASFGCKLTQGLDYNSADVGTIQGLVSTVGNSVSRSVSYVSDTFMLKDGTSFDCHGTVFVPGTSILPVVGGLVGGNSVIGGSQNVTVVQMDESGMVLFFNSTLVTITF